MQIFMILFIVAIVVIVIVSVIAKYTKVDQRGNSDQTATKSEEAEKRIQMYQQSKTQNKGQQQKAAVQLPPRAKMQPTINTKTTIAPRLASSLKDNAHTHPAASGNFRMEVVDMGGSLGGEITEGCAEHYFTRFVKVDDEKADNNEPNTELIKSMVYGELLLHPKFKKK